MQRIILTVTNDLSHDQRMQRICSTLVAAGYHVTLVGRVLPDSRALEPATFEQVRLRCRWRRGPMFYLAYNWLLFRYLMKQPCHAVGTVDLDTLLAGWAASRLRGLRRVFDAHEYFTEVPELTHKPVVRALWSALARWCLPAYRHAYTVGPALAERFTKMYGIPFEVVRNVPLPIVEQVALNVEISDRAPSTDHAQNIDNQSIDQDLDAEFRERSEGKISTSEKKAPPRVLLYQGALNMGRGIEAVLEAMPSLPDDIVFWLAGEGDLSAALRQRAQALGLGDRVRFWGWVRPADLRELTQQAWLGLNLLEARGLSYYYSLANKYFDYVQAGVPLITMDFPEYRALQAEYEVAILLPNPDPARLVAAVGHLANHPDSYARLQANCRAAREHWHWGRDSQVLLRVWADAMR
jgi:glycosyltransferase involved in cell wall biosynthesis